MVYYRLSIKVQWLVVFAMQNQIVLWYKEHCLSSEVLQSVNIVDYHR